MKIGIEETALLALLAALPRARPADATIQPRPVPQSISYESAQRRFLALERESLDEAFVSGDWVHVLTAAELAHQDDFFAPKEDPKWPGGARLAIIDRGPDAGPQETPFGRTVPGRQTHRLGTVDLPAAVCGRRDFKGVQPAVEGSGLKARGFASSMNDVRVMGRDRNDRYRNDPYIDTLFEHWTCELSCRKADADHLLCRVEAIYRRHLWIDRHHPEPDVRRRYVGFRRLKKP